MTHVTCRLTAKNQDQLRNPMLGNRVRATFTLPLPFLNWGCRLTQVDLCNGHTKVVVVLVVVLFVVRRSERQWNWWPSITGKSSWRQHMGFDVVLSHWVVTYRHDTWTCPVVQCLEVFVAFAVLSGLWVIWPSSCVQISQVDVYNLLFDKKLFLFGVGNI